MPFSTLVGNELAKSALTRMLEAKTVPSTLLFSGPDGVGKHKFALAFTCALFGSGHTPKLLSGNHPDLHILLPEGKGVMHPIESIRQTIAETGLPPFEAPAKVFVIDEAHQMLPSSSNALLKTLEEPPPGTYFILLSSQPELMLPTILSRCRKIPFFPIPQKQIEEWVSAQGEIPPARAKQIAFLAHGSLARAHTLLQNVDSLIKPFLKEFFSLRSKADYPRLLKLCEELEKSIVDAEESFDPEPLLDELFAWMRDLHLLKNNAPEHIYHLEAFAELKAGSEHPLPSLELFLDEMLKSRLALQRHVKLRHVLERLWLCTLV